MASSRDINKETACDYVCQHLGDPPRRRNEKRGLSRTPGQVDRRRRTPICDFSPVDQTRNLFVLTGTDVDGGPSGSDFFSRPRKRRPQQERTSTKTRHLKGESELGPDVDDLNLTSESSGRKSREENKRAYAPRKQLFLRSRTAPPLTLAIDCIGDDVFQFHEFQFGGWYYPVGRAVNDPFPLIMGVVGGRRPRADAPAPFSVTIRAAHPLRGMLRSKRPPLHFRRTGTRLATQGCVSYPRNATLDGSSATFSANFTEFTLHFQHASLAYAPRQPITTVEKT
ncbi:hypothetical protein GEV33_007612 [Tenebrio molitor]|uniref:Uncharacterized protein n=1 Tax=Tenebrio molitor TaxID=7067 RepID=A0A8J6HKB2_TENMO|nr:hypothetical protein GEV33_007612 [Tenebrio molitor]